MRNKTCVRGACLLVALWSASAWAGVAVSGGKLYTMEGAEAAEGVTILVSEGVIEAIGVDLEIPFDYERVDARGKVVTPGLIESYSQLGLVEISGEATTVDGNLSEYRLGPAFDVRYTIRNGSARLLQNPYTMIGFPGFPNFARVVAVSTALEERRPLDPHANFRDEAAAASRDQYLMLRHDTFPASIGPLVTAEEKVHGFLAVVHDVQVDLDHVFLQCPTGKFLVTRIVLD